MEEEDSEPFQTRLDEITQKVLRMKESLNRIQSEVYQGVDQIVETLERVANELDRASEKMNFLGLEKNLAGVGAGNDGKKRSDSGGGGSGGGGGGSSSGTKIERGGSRSVEDA